MNGFLEKNKKCVLNNWSNLFNLISNPSSYSKKNFQNFLDLGFPNTKLKDWKYNALNLMLKNTFIFPKKVKIRKKQIDHLFLPFDAIRLVFVDGKLNTKLSDKDFDFFKIEICSMNDINHIPIHPEIFLYLNESFSQKFTRIILPKKSISPRPLYLLHINTSNHLNHILNSVFYRHHIHLEKYSRATIFEHYISFSKHFSHFTSARISMKIENHAHVIHAKLAFENKKSYHVSHTDFILSENNTLKSYNFLLGNNLIRNQISSKINGKNSNIIMNSLALPKNHSICDIKTYLEHTEKSSFSRQLHKFIVYDTSIGIFNGLIKVFQNALKTDGKIINKNLLLSPFSKMKTKPELEIYADDVKCNHAVTIGNIDELQIFYLCSRGIQYTQAKKMIVVAFSLELVESVEDTNLKNIILWYISHNLLDIKNDF